MQESVKGKNTAVYLSETISNVSRDPGGIFYRFGLSWGGKYQSTDNLIARQLNLYLKLMNVNK